jgi:uncharacterized repeat protein (TIGR03803 family)
MKRIVQTLRESKRARWAYALCTLCAAAIALPAQTFNTLHSFNGTDGKHPQSGLVQTTNGDLYGTTPEGGDDGLPTPSGAAFKISTSGTFKSIHSFCSERNSTGECLDGAMPADSLMQAPNGDLYGTTATGGDNRNCTSSCGIVFKMTLSGTVTAIYNFCPDGTSGNCPDGEYPYAGVVEAVNGNFYGTTNEGGINDKCNDSSCGTIFEVTPSGTLTTLYNFCSHSKCSDGATPYAGLIQATSGDLYGTTAFGGDASVCQGGCGTVFKITTGGALTTLHSFCAVSGCPDGSAPYTPILEAADGNFYGTTTAGGTYGGGTIFQITPGGDFTTIYSFCTLSDCADGENSSGLIQATDGKLYGTTASGGAHSKGTIFSITPGSVPTTLYSFCPNSGCADGASPNALIQDTNGDFYGTTGNGGASNQGAIFSLSTGLGPFVSTQTTSGSVGAAVTILGTDLTKASKVTFNGTAAAFTVVSASEITTTVPDGATTGTVQVVTPSVTLSSNTIFTVR